MATNANYPRYPDLYFRLVMPLSLVIFFIMLASFGLWTVVSWPFVTWQDRRWLRRMREGGRVRRWAEVKPTLIERKLSILVVPSGKGNIWGLDELLVEGSTAPPLGTLPGFERAVRERRKNGWLVNFDATREPRWREEHLSSRVSGAWLLDRVDKRQLLRELTPGWPVYAVEYATDRYLRRHWITAMRDAKK